MQIYRRLDSSAEMIRWALAVSMALLVSMAQAQEGPVCRVCADASDEIVCSLEATQQCNPNQVCQTSARCTPNGVLMKKGCIGSSNVDALDTLECLNGDTKCNLFCDTDYCNDGSGPTVIAAIACSSDDSADDTVANPEPEDTSVAVTCQTCSDSTDEESCNAQETTKQCNPNQVCQTVVRCTSTGIFVKKGCVGSIDAADVNAAAVCKDADNDNCALYCTGDLCNQVSVDAFSEVLTCPVKATGIMCHSCTDSASEEECLTPETLEQCNPNQVCQTVVRCINTEGIMVKKGCVGAESAVDVNGGPSCDDETNTKCSTYCDTEQCNAGDVAAIGNLLACPVKAVGPMCRFCEESEDEATCDQGELIQCNPNQVCQTSRRCLGDGSGDSMIKKGCLGSGSTLETPFCETDENTKCLYTCDTDGCNDATSALIDSVIACPIKGVGPICTVCDEVDNEGDCNTQGDPQTCRESEVCFAKVLCDRPNETVRYKKRCMNINVVDMANINQMTCENIDNCSLACDSDYCNTDTSDLFESLGCPVKPPGIDCKKCADVYDESECEDVTCRDGNLCYTKVICERDSGLFRISKRCKRESRSDPTMLDNPVCPKDTKCEMTCGTDNCNAEAEPLLDIMECEVGPTDAPPTPTPEPEVTAEPEIPGPAEPDEVICDADAALDACSILDESPHKDCLESVGDECDQDWLVDCITAFCDDTWCDFLLEMSATCAGVIEIPLPPDCPPPTPPPPPPPTPTSPPCEGQVTQTGSDACQCACHCEAEECPVEPTPRPTTTPGSTTTPGPTTTPEPTTTPGPTTSPGPTTTTVICEDQLLDLILMVDASASIGGLNYGKVKAFLGDVINSLDIGPDAVHVGLIRFSEFDTTVLELVDSNTKEDIKNIIENLEYEAGTTATHTAIDNMVNMFQNNGRSEAVPVGILITDGQSNHRDFTARSVMSARAAISDLILIAVAVDRPEVSDAVDMNELRLIASGTGDSNILTVDQFGGLVDIVNTVAHLICEPEDITLAEDCSEVLMVGEDKVWKEYYGAYELTENTCTGDSHRVYRHVNGVWWIFFVPDFSDLPGDLGPGPYDLWAVTFDVCDGFPVAVLESVTEANPSSADTNWVEHDTDSNTFIYMGAESYCF